MSFVGALTRVALGDDAVDGIVAAGAAMTYDEIVQYAIDHLAPA